VTRFGRAFRGLDRLGEVARHRPRFNRVLLAPQGGDNATLSHATTGSGLLDPSRIACRRLPSHGPRARQHLRHQLLDPRRHEDTPVDRKGPRARLIDALDAVFKTHRPLHLDSVEGSCSHRRGKLYRRVARVLPVLRPDARILFTLDTGHYHPTRPSTDKISSSVVHAGDPAARERRVRWDSDHVVILLNDDLEAIGQELVRGDYLARTHIGLDYSMPASTAWRRGPSASGTC